jgi:hypothetical protein
MGVTMDAAWPTSELTWDSLELSVFRNIVLNSQNTSSAMVPPAKAEIGALIQWLLVTGMLCKINPHAPNAVTNEAITVGLKNEIPGTPLWSKPASA